MQGDFAKEVAEMVHHGGKISAAARKLAQKSTSKRTKSKAGKTMAKHKARYH